MSREEHKMDVEYRRLTPTDIPLALGMNADFRAGLVDRTAAEKFLNSERNWLFAAIHADKVIGFAYGYRMARMDGTADMLYIHEVGVADANALYRKVGGGVSSDSGGDDVCYFFMPEEDAK